MVLKQPPHHIVQHEYKAPDDWRFFLTGLCFIEFYTGFIYHGRWFWANLVENDSFLKYWNEDSRWYLVETSTGLLNALILLGLGRAIWRRDSTARIWLTPFIFFSLIQAVSLLATMPTSGWGTQWWGGWLEIGQNAAFKWLLWFAWTFHAMATWLALGLVGWAFIWRRRSWRHARRRPWIMLASTWALMETLWYVVLGQPLMPMGTLQRVLRPYTNIEVAFHLFLSATILSAVAGVWLVIGRRGLVLIPLIITVMHVVTFLITPFAWWSWLFHSADSYHHLLNRAAFDAYFVWPVEFAGPWLLIYLCARRFPARMPADDGSLFPRRYCSRCHYNLSGTSGQRCPECGADFLAPDARNTAIPAS